jgi:hypothetical protein
MQRGDADDAETAAEEFISNMRFEISDALKGFCEKRDFSAFVSAPLRGSGASVKPVLSRKLKGVYLGMTR